MALGPRLGGTSTAWLAALRFIAAEVSPHPRPFIDRGSLHESTDIGRGRISPRPQPLADQRADLNQPYRIRSWGGLESAESLREPLDLGCLFVKH